MIILSYANINNYTFANLFHSTDFGSDHFMSWFLKLAEMQYYRGVKKIGCWVGGRYLYVKMALPVKPAKW